MTDLVEVLGANRRVVLARELTKKFETILDGQASDVLQSLQVDDNQTRGEFVLLIAGVEEKPQDEVQQLQILTILLGELPVKQAAAITAKLTGQRKNEVYKIALALKDEQN